MKFEELLRWGREMPVVESSHLLVGETDPNAVQVQLSRWVQSGKLLKLRRGVYILAPHYRKIEIYEPYVASLLKRPSYLSLQKALDYHGLIPEAVSVYTSVTTKRPGGFETPLGIFDYRHVDVSLFWGYAAVEMRNQSGFIAFPEKAILDWVYLGGFQISFDFWEGLRLQNVGQFNLSRLIDFAKRFRRPPILRAAESLREYLAKVRKEERNL